MVFSRFGFDFASFFGAADVDWMPGTVSENDWDSQLSQLSIF
jgi:hypothetical protein